MPAGSDGRFICINGPAEPLMSMCMPGSCVMFVLPAAPRTDRVDVDVRQASARLINTACAAAPR